MRAIVNSTYITIDGVIVDPHRWPLFRAGSAATFELADTLTLDSGIVILTYRTKTA